VGQIERRILDFNKKFGNPYDKFDADHRISISNIKESLAVEFDQEGVAKKTHDKHFNDEKSIYYQKSVDEIIAMWTAKADLSKERGNLVDDFVGLEYSVWNNLNENETQAVIEETEDNVMKRKYKGVHAVLKYMKGSGLNFETRERPLYFVYHYRGADWLINGRFDAIFSGKTPDNEDLYLVVDWKNSEKIEESNKWQKLLGPMKDKDDCDLNKFTVQIFMYLYILKNGYGFKERSNACIVQFPGNSDYFYKIFQPGFEYNESKMKKIIEWSIDQRIKRITEKKRQSEHHDEQDDLPF